MPKELRAALSRTVQKHIRLIRDKIRMSMRAKKHGRIYYINGRRHRASAPGEAPAILTGALYRSIVPRVGRSSLQARIAPNVFYAQWLEEGIKKKKKKDGTYFKNSWRLAPRPYLKPAFDQQRDTFNENVQSTVTRVLKRRAAKRREK